MRPVCLLAACALANSDCCDGDQLLLRAGSFIMSWIITILVYWQHYCTVLQQRVSAKLCGMVQGMELWNFHRGHHLYLAGQPSHWASAHILVSNELQTFFNHRHGSHYWYTIFSSEFQYFPGPQVLISRTFQKTWQPCF